MSRRSDCSVLVLFLFAAVPALGADPVRFDRHCDPLPPGALARIGTLRFAERAGRAYAAVAYSPDGKLLASVDTLGNVDLWDVKAGKLLRSFGPPEGKRPPGEKLDLVTNWPYASWQALAVFGPDSRTLLTGSDHWPVRVWDTTLGKELAVMEGSQGGVLALAVAPDFQTVAAAGKTNLGHWPHLVPDGLISLWDVSNGKSLRQWRSEGAKVWTLAWSHDGQTLASGDDDKCVRFWDPGTGKSRGKLAGFERVVVGVAYAPDGKTLATADMERSLALWDLAADNKRLRTWRVVATPSNTMPPGWPSLGALLFTPDGKRLLTRDLLNECPVDVWEVTSGKRLWQFPLNVGHAVCPACAVSPDGSTLATVQPGCLYDLATGKQRLDSPGWRVDRLIFLPDGRTLVTNEHDLWDAATGQKLRSLDVRMPSAVSPDGKHFVEWGQDALSLRDLATGKEVRPLPTAPVPCSYTLVFSPDGRTFAALNAAGNTAIRFWDIASGAEQKSIRLTSCPRHVSRIVFSPDGLLIAGVGQASGGKGQPQEKAEEPAGPCYLWDRASGRQLRTLDLGPIPATTYFSRKVAFSPDGRVLASFGDNGCQLWEVASGQRLRRLTENMADAAAFSPDGRLLAWAERAPGDVEYVIRLTDTTTGKLHHRLSGHTKTVCSLAFSPDGKRLASGAEDASALVWDLSTLPPGAELKAITLTEKELQTLWADLGGADAVRAREAIATLARAPGETVAFLDARRAEWTKKVETDGKRIVSLLADVDSDEFGVREEATKALLAIGPRALPFVRKHLRDGKMSLDAQRRLEQVCETLETGEQQGAIEPLDLVRAIGVLERIGNPEARRVLERLAEGMGPAADQAQASLHRLKR
jgi:WD40 repeat protein